jgi:hypothetical protein
MTEVIFIVSESMKDVAIAVGIPTRVAPQAEYPVCPFSVGDFIAWPSAPGLAFRVTWRLYRDASEEKPARWMLGLEKASHPLFPEDPPSPAPRQG